MDSQILIVIIISSLVATLAAISLTRRIKNRLSVKSIKKPLPETSSTLFVENSKYNGTLAMVAKNVLPPSMNRNYNLSNNQALKFKRKRDDLKIDGWVSDGHIRGEYHEVGNEHYYVYSQPMRIGRRGIDLDDYLINSTAGEPTPIDLIKKSKV